MSAMGDVLPYRPPRAREENTASIGMVVFLASWAMMFASLFLAYGFLRSRAGTWPPAGVPLLPRLLPGANTAVLALSSLALQVAVVSARRGRVGRVGPAVLGAAVLGALFLSLQTLLWLTLQAQGLRPETGGPYASVFYGLTWLHAAHVVVGLLGLAVVCRRAFRGDFNAVRHMPVRLWAMYWHFVGVVWMVMYVTIFLM